MTTDVTVFKVTSVTRRTVKTSTSAWYEYTVKTSDGQETILRTFSDDLTPPSATEEPSL